MSIERDSVDSTADGVRVNIRQNIEEQCYIPLSEKLLNSNNWYDEKELATGSEVTAEAHENRTVLELIQNARDAIRKASTDSASDVRDGSVAVVVGPERLYVANTGEPFHLDKEEVLERVRRLGMGKENDETIGEKGVGMRSILALGERFGVHSTITRGGSEETVSVEFSTAHPWAMLTRRYSDILASRDPELLDRITPSRSDTDHLDQYADCLDQVVEEMDTVSAESTILSANDDWPNAEAIMESMSNVGPPSPGDVIGGLPELSAFKYPLLRDGTSEDPIVRTLLGQHEGTIPPDDDLAGRLREDQYTTVVSVEYEDDARTQLLELFGETFGDAGAELDLPVEEWRQAASSDRSSADRRQEIWDECKETISREVLVLLGEIETIDLILLGDSAERKVTASERFRCNHRDSTVDNSDSGRDLQLRRLTVTHDERAASATSTAATAEFHLYTSEWEHAATDDDEDNRLRLLLEEPEERDDWRPAPHPLHLYYPIENETTPFPFILHAPFEVQRDRQSLDSDDEKNAALLADGALEEFLIETIAHIVNGESALQPWLPWLVMPLRGGDREPTSRNGYVSEFVDSVCTELSRSNCVPTFGGGSAPPGEVLLEVSGYRLDAFDPPREYLETQGCDEHRRLPAQAVVANGRHWLQTVEDQGILKVDRFRDAAERIELTTLLDRVPGGDHADGKTDFISVLDDIWGVNGVSGNGTLDLALRVGASTARAYFETVIDRLPDDDSGPARELGQRHIPLIPALDYSGEQVGDTPSETSASAASDSTESIGRLVRAIDRASESKLERNRIVFREVSSETQRNIGPPPHPFEVYLVPYEESWSTALDTYADEWGTTQFERDTDIYQRVAAELGGYGEGTLPVDSVDDRPLEYLYSAYTQINRGRQDPSADLFVPIPYQGWHYHKRFTESADSAGIGNLLRGENFESISDDNYLFQLYIKRIEVPTSDGAWEPADQVAFGRDWAAKFSAAATHLDQADADDPFEGKRAGETGIADDFRRWAAAIDCAATIRDDATPELAPPAELRDLLGLSRSGSPDSDDAEGEDWVWTINFLLHLGLQVGPHIEWAWLNPVNTKQSSDRRPRALFLDEAKQLSDGSLPNTAGDALPVSPTRAELDRYADVCRRVHNHPAFVVNHAPDCQESAIQAYDEWSIKAASHGYRPVVIPLWWRFSNPPSDDTIETARSFRDAVLLLWPELSDRLFPTGWVCGGAFGNKHQVKSPRDRIPGLGVVQLRESPIWPVADTATDDQAEEQPAFLPAMSLVDGHRINALKQIDLDTIAETWQSEFEDAGDSLSFRSVIPEGDLKTWLAISISELSPAGAAERLDALLEEYTGNSAHPSDSWYGLVREEAFKLLRRFRPENAPDTVSDEDIARQWIRRDIYHTGTQLIVDEGNAADTIQVGAGSTADATVYDEALPGYATEQLQVRSERFVRLPTTNPGPIANVLADKTDGVDAVEFGIELRDVPIRPTVSGDIAGTRHQEMSEALGKRVADLAAAYAVEATGSKSSPGHVQRIEKRLHTAVEHVYSISSHEIDGDVGDVSSVKWVRESGDGIETEAFGIALLVGDAEPHHAVDALVDIVENEAVKDKFEVVLRADPGLERYRETRESFDLGDIERNELQRLLRSTLPALAAGVSRVLSNRNHSPVDYAFEVPDDDDTVEDHHGDLETFVRNGTYSDIVARYISDLTSGPLEEDQAVACLHASIYIAFERNNRAAVATLVDLLAGSVPDVAAGLTAVNEVVDELDLDNWGQFDANTLGEYLTAIALVEEFYSLLESHNDESDIRNHAATVRGKIDTLSPSPLDPIELVFPAAVRRTVDGDHSLPVVVFALLEDIENPPIRTDRSPENLHRQFSDWCADEHAEAEHLVGMSLAEWRLCDHFEDGDMAAVLPAVKAMLTPSEQSTRRENQRGRTNKQRDFDRGEVISEAQISPDSSGSDVEFPAVSTGSSHGDIKEEFTGADGRTGELFCIENAWEEFQTAGPAQPRIIKAVRDWRDGCHEPDQWRLQQTDDVFASVDAVSDLSGNFAFEKLRDRLCDADENWEERRKWFRMLVDVSEEKGPGFDYIDPFGGHYGSEYEASEWDPEWMRRVEVKSLSGRPDGGFKVTLTGNEFRMARRSCDLCNGRRYLVRLVFGRREGAQFHPTDLRDIDDILTEYGGSGADTAEVEARVWDALRGGSVPLRGSFE